MTPQQAAHLTHLAGQNSAAPAFGVMWHAHNLAAETVCDAGEYVMKRKNRQRGRAPQFAPRKAARAFRAVLPAWALAVFTVCLAVPGPFDEIAAILASLVLLVVRFPRARSAWRGGKSHRASNNTQAARS